MKNNNRRGRCQLWRFCIAYIKPIILHLRLEKCKIRACVGKLSKKQVDKFWMLGPQTQTGIFTVTPTITRDSAGLPKFQRFYYMMLAQRNNLVGTIVFSMFNSSVLTHNSLICYHVLFLFKTLTFSPLFKSCIMRCDLAPSNILEGM